MKEKNKKEKILSLFVFGMLMISVVSFSVMAQCGPGGCGAGGGATNAQVSAAYGGGNVQGVTGNGMGLGGPDGSLTNQQGQQVAASPGQTGGYNDMNFGGGQSSFSNGAGSKVSAPQGNYPKAGGGGGGCGGGGCGGGGGGGGGSGGGGVGGGGAGGGAGGGQQGQQFLQLFQSLAPLLAQFAQDDEEDKDNDQQSSLTQRNLGGGGTSFEFQNMQLRLAELEAENRALSSTTNAGGEATISTAFNNLRTTNQNNADTSFFSSGNEVARVQTPLVDTSVVFDTTSQNAFSSLTDTSNNPSLSGITGPILLNSLSIIPQIKHSAIGYQIQTSSSQFVHLIDQKVEMNGHNIKVFALKTFDTLRAGGQDLSYYVGEKEDLEIRFEAQKIMYPRIVKKAPHGLGEISNKLDSNNNRFSLQHYTNRKSFLKDENEIISIGDLASQHPNQNLIISHIREDLWVRR